MTEDDAQEQLQMGVAFSISTLLKHVSYAEACITISMYLETLDPKTQVKMIAILKNMLDKRLADTTH